MRIGALEAGGTKMVCAIGTEQGEILDRVVIPTTTPKETTLACINYFLEQKIEALGIGCFGPIELHREAKNYGMITTTPKLAWQNYNIVSAFQEALSIPVGFDTDVNAACLGEATYGASADKNSLVYITIGTGIGAGIMLDGKLLHGMLHPEAGHILLEKLPTDLAFSGSCPFHANCFEGLAAGPAIKLRYGVAATELFDRSEVWERESEYIAQAVVNYILTLSPERIILGGGVMHVEGLMPLVRAKVTKKLNGYLDTKELKDMDSYLVLPSLRDNQGVLGCIKLALLEMENKI